MQFEKTICETFGISFLISGLLERGGNDMTAAIIHFIDLDKTELQESDTGYLSFVFWRQQV